MVPTFFTVVMKKNNRGEKLQVVNRTLVYNCLPAAEDGVWCCFAAVEHTAATLALFQVVPEPNLEPVQSSTLKRIIFSK